MCSTVVVYYDEIALKGKNRGFFENTLARNIRKALKKNVQRKYGCIIFRLSKGDDIEKIKNALKIMPGIAFFSFALSPGLAMEEIKKASLDMMKNETFSTFKVVASRPNKKFPETSQQINNILGEHLSKGLQKKVDVKTPDIKLHVKISEKEAFVYTRRYAGLGGLPTGTSGTAVSLLSGGIDSPVASFLMMKRGCRIVFLHVHNETAVHVLEKLEAITKELAKFQLGSRMYIVPFGDIQKEIIASVPSKFRMIVYRRFMMKIANEIAEAENARAIVTGDSLGQVASQTMENLGCIYQPSKLPVFAPLIGMNKKDITAMAREIGTYDYSILPYPDCCSFMVAEHPETRACMEEIAAIEENIEKTDELVKSAVSRAEISISTAVPAFSE